MGYSLLNDVNDDETETSPNYGKGVTGRIEEDDDGPSVWKGEAESSPPVRRRREHPLKIVGGSSPSPTRSRPDGVRKKRRIVRRIAF